MVAWPEDYLYGWHNMGPDAARPPSGGVCGRLWPSLLVSEIPFPLQLISPILAFLG